MNINWHDIYLFLIVAESGSLSQAARRLDTSQSTLSRRIEALEADLGLSLFKRHSRGLDLTHEGMRLVEQARQMMHSAANIERLANGEQMKPEGVVRISLPEGLCNELIVPTLGEFQQRYPKLQIVLGVTARASDLMRGEADLALRLYRPIEPDLMVRKLGEMSLGLYASREYLQRHPAPASLADLARHDIIGYGDQLSGLEENQWLLQHCSEERVVLRSDSTSCRLRAACSGVGISIQPIMIAQHQPALVSLLQGTEMPGHEIWLTYHRDLARSYPMRLVANWLAEVIIAQSEQKKVTHA